MKANRQLKTRYWLIAAIMLAMVSGLGMTSCIEVRDDYYDDYYYDGIVGVWELTGVPLYSTNQFVFRPNGTGYYSAYDYRGNWQTWSFTYDIYGSRLRIDLIDGQTWWYQYSLRGNMLILIDMEVPGNALYYQYVY